MPFCAERSPCPVGHKGQRRLQTFPDSTVIFVGRYGSRTQPSRGATCSIARLYSLRSETKRSSSRAIRNRVHKFGTATPAAVLLNHVPLPGAVLAHGLVVALDGGVEVADRVATRLADLVTELEAVDLAGVAHELAVVVRAALLRHRRGQDATRVVVVRLLAGRVADDAAQVAVRLLIRGPEIASDSLHVATSSHLPTHEGRRAGR